MGDDSDELSPLPPPPAPQPYISNASNITSHRVHFENDLEADEKEEKEQQEEEENEEHIRPMAHAPKPHPHPFQTKISSSKQKTHHKEIYGHRLDHAFLNPDKIAFYTSTIHNEEENMNAVVSPSRSNLTTTKLNTDLSKAQINSTRAILKQVETIEHLPLKEPELNQIEKTMAAKKAVGLRNEIQYTPNTKSEEEKDLTKPRTMARKVPKQIDPKWLKKRSQDMRPIGPLEREDERDLYETCFKMSEILYKERRRALKEKQNAIERKKQVEQALDVDVFSNIIDRVTAFHRRSPEFIYY
jgi:hypothetical protein